MKITELRVCLLSPSVSSMCVYFLKTLLGSLLNEITLTGAPSLYQVMTGVGLPITSHIKLMGWFTMTDRFPCMSLSRRSGGTVEMSKVTNYTNKRQ